MKQQIFKEMLARRAAAIAKDRVYVDSPDEAPEGVQVQQGDRGGLWYPSEQAEGTGTDQDGDGEPETPEPVQWDRPEPDELDEYVDKVQSSDWWSNGHEEFKKSWEEGKNTENEHTNEDGEYDPERAEKHQEWAEDLLNEDARVDPDSDEDPVGVILLGPPGAGKGWWQEQVEEGAYGDSFDREFTHISSDATKEPIPEYDGENASYVHDEASHIAKNNLAPEAIDRNHNVVVDKVATSPESTKRMIENMEEQGYDIRASFVDVPSEKSAYNVVQRYHDEGRFTPLDYTVGARDDSWESFQEITEDIPEEKVGVFNNDVEWGNPPEPEEVGEDLFKQFMRRLAQKNGYTLLTTFTEVRRFMCAGDEALRDGRRSTRTSAAGRERRGDSGVDGRELLVRSGGGDGTGRRVTRDDLVDAAQSILKDIDGEDFRKEWVSDPTEQAPNRWTNTATGEHRYQETKPDTGAGLTDEEDSGGAVGDQELRRAIEQLENPSREDVQEYFGLDEVNWSVYEDEGVDSFDLSTAVSMTLAEYDTMEEFNSAVESGEFDVELQDNYSLYSDPDDLAQLEGEIAQNIRDDAAQMHVEELVTENADAVRSVTDEPDIPQGEEDEETTEDEGGEDGGGYEDEYESFDLHNVEFSEVSEDDYLVIDGRRGREKIKVQSVEESDEGKVIISGVTPDGRSSGVVSDREGSQILGQLQDGEAYKSGVERGVQETIEQYDDTIQEVKDNFTNSDIRDGLEEFDAGRQGSFKRLSSSAAMSLRSTISDAVGDKEAVDELWARMNEMKQSSTGSQREYVDALAKETFGIEDADTWGDADPDDYDFSEADKEAMAVAAAASQRVLEQAGDNKIHRGVREGGSAQLAKAWLEDPMATDFEINENATANYSSLEDVARGYGDITVDKDVTEGAVLNANDMIRGMYRSSAAADEAEVWAPGSEQSVSSWDVSIGSERVEGEYERMYLGDYQGPIEEIEDEKFLRRMGKQIEHLQKSEDIDSLSDEAKKNLQKFGERMDDVLSDYDFDEVVDDLMEKNDSGSVIDLTSEAGWLDELRDEESDDDDSDDDMDKFVKAAESVLKDWVSDPTEQAPNRWTHTETGEHRYQETKPGSSEDGGESTEDNGPGEADDGTDIDSVDDLPTTEKIDMEISLDNETQVSDISDYRAGSFSFVNEALRGSREVNDEASRIIESVSDAIDEAGDFEEATVYRGLEATPELADKFEEGETVRLGGFQSTSHDPSTASNFARTPDWDDERKDIIMEIDTTRGFPTYSSDELGEGIEADEVILGHNWSYRIEGVSEVGGKMKVNMSLVGGGNDE
ncbi:zeta toxin [Haloarcula virus HVTV-2]|uniref:Zeta toxin n=1 Tax=Haloarcula vallismortis tailed virus 1 TaxID=1262528 RepID=L7TGZ4_9CAUD|nr:zeta toxin [Haloarcula vallismortis tailed virus 1]AGC34484.1 zeta toxin [Haloarcula vallismortis tailed virus 1]UBF22922.1 zeta toxin [Haloarcula virus HVTV-2]